MSFKNIHLLPTLLLPWFSENARVLPWRQDKNPYHVWISEIMLQQTRTEAVRNYYSRFLDALPTVKCLAEAEEETVLKLWEGLGYYSRARNLIKAAQKIMADFSGEFPRLYKDILSLPGIGEYTAGAISSICFGSPTPAVDGNVLRVFARLSADETSIDLPKVKKDVNVSLAAIYPEGHCGDFTQSLMELGATVCIPKSPRCIACPLSEICEGYKKGIAATLPKRTPKNARTLSEKTVFYFYKGNSIALKKRDKKGLLAGLWELPNTEGKLSVSDAVRLAEDWGLAPDAPVRSVERVHIFTHAEWHMRCYYIPCKKMPSAFIWAMEEDMKSAFPLPTAFRIFLETKEEN